MQIVQLLIIICSILGAFANGGGEEWGGGNPTSGSHYGHYYTRGRGCQLYDWNPKQNEEFDFIVVGAGAAGSIVASRLAETGDYDILILEAGGPSQRDLCGEDYVQSSFYNDSNGALQVGQPFTRYDVPYYYTTVGASPALAQDEYQIPGLQLARLVGGGMGHNGVVWMRPTQANLDEWGVQNWGWDNFLPYLKKAENVSDTPFAFDTAYRGLDGPIKIESAPFRFDNDYAVYNACLQLGEYNNPDVNGATRKGCAYLQQNIRRGVRSSSAIEYLRPELLLNPRIKARIHAQATKILFNSSKVATGIQYYINQTSLFTATARKEVILAGGAINTPKLLILSGIGPAAQLSSFHIPVVHTNENVGQHLRNHKVTSVGYHWYNPTKPNVYSFGGATLQYATSGTGFLAQSPVAGQIFSFNTSSDPEPDITTIFNWGYTNPITDPYDFGVSVWTSSPQGANGTVTLNSTNPFVNPNVNQNLLAYPPDTAALARGVRKVRQLFSTPIARAFFNVTETRPGPAVQTDAQFNTYLNTPGSVTGAYHYLGTCRMGNSGDPTAVVDNHLRVLGVSNLRVIDGSIATGPFFFGAQAGVTGIAEKGVEILIADLS